MHRKKSLKFNFLLSLLLTLLLFPSLSYAQQEERSTQAKLVRDNSLFPLQSTGIWTEVHPLIPRVDYWGIDFANADTGWAVGEGGGIIKTTNGGQKWIWYESGVENTLRTVAAVNNGQRVIAAGDGGKIIISEDAGETWNTIPSGTTDNIWNLQMITDEIGWMVGEGGTALKTTNGGGNWIQQPMPYPTAPYWDISFLDTLFGYVCSSSGIVLKTTNGGGNWIIQVAGDTRSLWTICAIDTHRASGGGFAGKLVYTTDGGSSWLSATGASVNANKIKFINNNKGFLASDGGLYKSINGGVSWSRINDLNLGSSVPKVTNISFPTVTKGLVSGGKMLLAKSTNEGENWKRTIVNGDLLNVYFKNGQEGFINSSNLIYKTNDGGYTLDTLLTFPYNQILYMDAMNYFDSLTGFIGASRPKIYKTIDSGENWYLTNIAGLTDTIGAIIKFFSQTQLISWAIKSKQIMKTTDGGENWFVQLNLPGAGYFSSIHFIDSLYGWASMLSRRPFKTTDGGENWIEQTNLNFYQTDDVYFKDTLNGLLLDWNKLYRTIDGGITWTLDALVTGFDSGRFGYFDSENIFITGNKVYRTTNAGVIWTEFPELADQGWRITITLYDVNSGFLVGNTGLIFKYYDETIPVELINFEGWLNENETLLQWTTATEINNRGFYVQRKELNEQEWTNLDFIEGKGNSTEINYYSYKDFLAESGVYYYRLKQVDYDGSFEYSDVVEVEWRAFETYLLEQNYPNPFNPTTTISFAIQNKSNVKIIILNAIGEEVAVVFNEEKESGYHTVEFNAASLPSGIYFYQLKAGEFSETRKMILLK